MLKKAHLGWSIDYIRETLTEVFRLLWGQESFHQIKSCRKLYHIKTDKVTFY